ncbi:enoyl-CoA hydratase/isomerase family protein [Roseisolibacter sp. H3M3-2]|uniref:enoyl-CoA hydratase/isomerase family protein n=1 Tax=Roseisolibacter sp. H3M3-2 TaxID=3031323 RepID=UPI0023DB8930|nr:enoyl-CoA hydratase/isomerase family protein [Roseisolibacter sp. H3M3-2]MDF1502041.1 enoyl-CoA hydratase/isomerase family protein [Roseisolibacter sp. H3M3-2]
MTHPLPPAGLVATETADGIATVRFGHPKGNSLPGAILRELAAQVRRAGQDPAARVIVLRSEGTGPFCAGASFDELVAIDSPERGREFFSGFAGVILAMLRAPKFVLTRVHGKTTGGGVGLVAASDYAIATAGAACKLSELAVGIGPFVVGPVIEKRIGNAAFAQMAVDADWRDARWAHTHGLYATLVDDVAALDAAVDAMARRLAGFNPEAMADIKRVAWEGTETWDALLAERAEISGRLVLSEFTRSAIAKFKGG